MFGRQVMISALASDTDPVGQETFNQPDKKKTFTELLSLFDGNLHTGALITGLTHLVILVLWGRSKRLSALRVPGALVVVLGHTGCGAVTSAVELTPQQPPTANTSARLWTRSSLRSRP